MHLGNSRWKNYNLRCYLKKGILFTGKIQTAGNLKCKSVIFHHFIITASLVMCFSLSKRVLILMTGPMQNDFHLAKIKTKGFPPLSTTFCSCNQSTWHDTERDLVLGAGVWFCLQRRNIF